LVCVSHAVAQKAIENAGTETARQKWLPAMVNGHRLGAFAVHKPQSGCDAGAITTTARKEGDQYILKPPNGSARTSRGRLWESESRRPCNSPMAADSATFAEALKGGGIDGPKKGIALGRRKAKWVWVQVRVHGTRAERCQGASARG
jgi:hypothetical protein